jgi:hypothetical protein
MPVHTVGLTFKTDAGNVPISNVPFIVDTEINQLILVTAGTVNKEVDVTFEYARIQDYCISLLTAASAGKSEALTGTVTLKWNSSSAPVPLMTLAAKVPIWHAPTFGTTSVFTANLTKCFFSNAGTVDLYVGLHIGLNDTV